MVYTGKPSTGCGTCRKRRIKCDEGRPYCGQCIKSKRECLGYRDSEDLLFRDETSVTESRVSRKERSRLAMREWRPDINAQSIHDTALKTIPRSFSQDYEKTALSFFIGQFVLMPRHMESTRGYMEYLIPVYTNAKKGSPLFPAISATALCTIAHRRRDPGLFQKGREMYGQACATLQAAINDPIRSRSNDTLMAVLLLTLYDMLAATRVTLFQWGTHADGAAALVRHRGEAIFADPISERLYWAVMTQSQINQIVKCEPMEPFMDWTDLWSQPLTIDPKLNASSRLTMMTARLPALRYAALKYLRVPMSGKVLLKILSLKSHALAFEEYYLQWQHTIPQSWSFTEVGTTEGQEGDPQQWEYWPGPIHGYYDIWVTNTWNSWRTNRILCNYIILNCCERLYPSHELESVREYQTAKAVIKDLVETIVASVPYLLGYCTPLFDAAESVVYTTDDDVSMNRSTKTKPDHKTHQEAANTLGGWFLSWHLFVCASCTSIDPVLRLWMKGRLLSIGEKNGVGQASVLAALGMEINGLDQPGRGLSVVDMNPPPFTELPDFAEAMAELETEDSNSERRSWRDAQAAENFTSWKEEFQAMATEETDHRPFWQTSDEEKDTLGIGTEAVERELELFHKRFWSRYYPHR